MMSNSGKAKKGYVEGTPKPLVESGGKFAHEHHVRIAKSTTVRKYLAEIDFPALPDLTRAETLGQMLATDRGPLSEGALRARKEKFPDSFVSLVIGVMAKMDGM